MFYQERYPLKRQMLLRAMRDGLPDFMAVTKVLFAVMVANYLLYFYQPSVESGIPTLITQGVVIFGVLTLIGFVKALGHVIDAFTDPIIANFSDKCRHRDGRRIPFMKYAAIPYALCALFIFFAPDQTPTLRNNVWVAFFIWAYFIFYTLYIIPHTSLLPEMVTDQKRRMNAYTISSFLFGRGGCIFRGRDPFSADGKSNRAGFICILSLSGI